MESFNNREAVSGAESIKVRNLVSQLLGKWYLFVIFALVGLAGSYVSSRYSVATYQVNATIFVPRQPVGIEAGFEGVLPGELTDNQCEVYNQIEIIRSYSIHRQVVQNLNWRISWFRKDRLCRENLLQGRDPFHWVACYQDEPFQVEEMAGASNLTGFRLYIEPLSASRYRISGQGEIYHQAEKKLISFQSTATFGEPFTNGHFHFIIRRNHTAVVKDNCQYCFVFNNLSQQAASYRARLLAGLNDKESELIRLQLSGRQPRREMDYLNELIKVYMQNKVNNQNETQRQSLRFIEKQLAGMSDSLTMAGTRFSLFRAHHKVVDISQQGYQIMRMLGELETGWNSNQLKLDYFRNLLDYLQRPIDLKQIVSPSVVGIQDASLNKLAVTLSELYARRQIMCFSARENNPALVLIDQQIAQTNARLKENLGNLIRNAEVLNQTLQRQRATLLSQLNQLPKTEQELTGYQRHFDLTNATYTYLLQRRAEIDLALAGATSRVQVIDAARPETIRQLGPSTRSKLMMGLLLGLAFPAAFLLGTSFFSTIIEKQEDIENRTSLPMLGHVCHSPIPSNTPVNDRPQSAIAEGYRTIRTNLQFMIPARNRKIIGIHSVNPGEGKSFTSVNLAGILAMNNKKVILVGCDLRKPILHKIFRCPSEHGLSTYLGGRDELEAVVMKSDIENLFLLPAGPVPPNPSELLDKPAFGHLLQTLSRQYDYVILDNAPLAQVSDGLLTARHSELNLLILRYRVSKKNQLNFINQLSENNMLVNPALVVNDISGPGFSYGFNDYYYQSALYGYCEQKEEVRSFKFQIKSKKGLKG